jgi:hypothetical protein
MGPAVTEPVREAEGRSATYPSFLCTLLAEIEGIFDEYGQFSRIIVDLESSACVGG